MAHRTSPRSRSPLVGLMVGSFLNVCIYRLPLGRSRRTGPRSRCAIVRLRRSRGTTTSRSSAMSCSRGRCRYLPQPHLASVSDRRNRHGGGVLSSDTVFGPTPLLLVRLRVCVRADRAVRDRSRTPAPAQRRSRFRHRARGLSQSLVLPPGFGTSLIGALAGGGMLCGRSPRLYFRLRKEEAWACGDVKMLAMIGAFLGWKLVVLTLVLSSARRLVRGVLLLVTQRGDLKAAIPFGTFLAAAALVASLYGDALVALVPEPAALKLPHADESTLLLFMLGAVIFALASVLAIAVMRFAAAVRRLSRSDRPGRETMLMADAVQDAVHRLRSEERAMKARAEESERLSSEIIGSMTSGVLVVDEERRVRTLNPAGLHLLQGLTRRRKSRCSGAAPR